MPRAERWTGRLENAGERASAYRCGFFLLASFTHRNAIHKENIMGKYFIGWLLGIPAVVLVILYFIFG